MSLHTVGYSTQYVLPASQDAVPESFRSNRMAKPINCSVQTVNVPSLSGNATASGTSVVQVPCGASAGLLTNMYLKFSVSMTKSAASAAGSAFLWKGSTRSATALINRISTYLNSTQCDNIQNADQVYDLLFAHSTSNDWLTHDATLLLGSNVSYYQLDTAADSVKYSFCVPMIGLLGSQQAIPAYLINGQLQIQIDWNTVQRSISNLADANATNINGFNISDVQLCYDKVMPENAFIDHVRSQMMGGQKYVLGYTNYQCTTLATQAQTSTFNYGLNVSSLRGVIANQVLAADLSAIAQANRGDSSAATCALTQFSVQLDGRLISSLTLNASTSLATVFAELQKSQGRIFDASITDAGLSAVTAAGVQGGTYLSQFFAVGQSCQRVNEGLAFSGSPVSVVTLSVTNSAANYTMFIVFISDFQMIIDSAGSVELIR